MKKDFAGALLLPSEFTRLRELCAADPLFPDRFEGWCSLVREGEMLAREAGIPIEPTPVNVDFFEKWCRLTSICPCLHALRAMLIVEREGAHQGLRSLAERRERPVRDMPPTL